MVKEIEAGNTADSPEAQAIVARWHQHMHYFYEPAIERLRGLGQLYTDSPDFAAFLREAITVYYDILKL